MSYILEALKKSERDRAVGGVPDLSSEPNVYPRSRAGSRWVLGAVLVLVGLSFGFALSRYGERPASRASVHRTLHHPSMPTRAPLQDVAPLHPAKVVRPDLVGVTAQNSAPPVAAKPIYPASKDVGTAPGGTVGPAPVASSGASQPRAAPSASPPATSPADLPLLQDLPANIRQGLPALHVDVHVYDKDPSRRFVLINMQRYRQGDTLAAGPRLLRITKNGVVLKYRGVRFRLGSD